MSDEEILDNKKEISDNDIISKDPVLSKDIFENRRKMAWLSIYSIIAMTIFLLLSLVSVFIYAQINPKSFTVNTNDFKTYLDWSGTFIGWGYMAFISIIGAYMGASTYFYKNYIDMKKKD